MAETAVLGYSTLMDVVNEYTSLDAKGTYIWAAEVLNRKCPLVRVLPMVASNQIMSNIGSRDTYIGSPGTRRFNEGIVPAATHSAPLSEPIAMYEDYSEVDYALWRIQNDPNAWRQSQDRRKVEGFTQKIETSLYYGNYTTVDPGGFNGLATRFNSLVTYPNNDSAWYYNVVSGGGGTSANTTSIWVIEFGERKVYGLYPKNLPGGLEIEDLGKVTKEAGYAQSTAGALYEVLRTHFTWFMGIEIDDERCVQRYSSIATSGTSNIFDEEVLIQLKNQLPGMGEDPGTVIFCNRTIKTQMDIRAVSQKLNTYFTQEASGDVWGRPVTRFQGIPVMVAEMILNTETGLS